MADCLIICYEYFHHCNLLIWSSASYGSLTLVFWEMRQSPMPERQLQEGQRPKAWVYSPFLLWFLLLPWSHFVCLSPFYVYQGPLKIQTWKFCEFPRYYNNRGGFHIVFLWPPPRRFFWVIFDSLRLGLKLSKIPLPHSLDNLESIRVFRLAKMQCLSGKGLPLRCSETCPPSPNAQVAWGEYPVNLDILYTIFRKWCCQETQSLRINLILLEKKKSFPWKSLCEPSS